MKVGHLTGSVSRKAGGLFHSVRNLAIHTQNLGHQVTVFGLKDEFTEADLPAWGTVPVRAHRIVGPQGFGFSPGLIRSIETSRIDLLHVHGLWMYPSVASLSACRKRNIPCIISPHGMLDPWAVRNSAWRKKVAIWLYEGAHLRNAACLRALCESEAAAMRALGLRNAICIIPNGQKLPVDAPGKQVCVGQSLTGGRRALLSLSRLHPKKGLPDLLRAWASCQKTDPEAADWTLTVAGVDQNGHEGVLRRLVIELGIEKSVGFAGPLFNGCKAQAFERASAFVLPSLSEGLPNAILEAWAWRLPVLMTPQCNLPEGFAEGAAVRVDPNLESLNHGLRTLFRMSESEREQMGERGRRLVEERFSWPRVAERMVCVYNWKLGTGPRPDCVREA
jgi:poly(glycerol-phosphate) alpha-glucosyltransferase